MAVMTSRITVVRLEQSIVFEVCRSCWSCNCVQLRADCVVLVELVGSGTKGVVDLREARGNVKKQARWRQ
jgi:hypothetical protein